VSIPKQSSVWDERRNTSLVIPPPPGAAADALKAVRSYMRRYPRHARWIVDGHPNMTDDEHYARFGMPYKKGELS
jgi:hypothetical protein